MEAETLDRLKSAFGSAARGADPLVPYGNLYRAKVRALRGTTRIDVEPDDPAIPPMANIPLKVGVPGLEVELVPGHVVMVGWENHRPDRPYATTWSPGADGTVPKRTTVFADAVELGGRGGESITLGESQMRALQALLTTLAPITIAVPPEDSTVGGSLLIAFKFLEAVAIGPLAALKPGFIGARTALENFASAMANANDFLSQVTTTK